MDLPHDVPAEQFQPVLLSAQPLVTECPPVALNEWLTPSHLHYVRHHFDTMHLPPDTWQLQVDGLVEQPLLLNLDAIRAMPHKTLSVTLECAGNGRSRFQPKAEGNPFTQGAVSTAFWTGAPLAEVLAAAKVHNNATAVWFFGADQGPQGEHGTQPYGRGLTLEQAGKPDVLLAYQMNGEPLTDEHGAPLRLLVPGWYGMASVKWLNHIQITDQPYRGYFQVDRYVYKVPGRDQQQPVARMRVKSLLTSPLAGQTLQTGMIPIRGMAWAGDEPVGRVEFSADGGQTWERAELETPRAPYSWQAWCITWNCRTPGQYQLVCRAMSRSAQWQPERPEWNVHGYGNNALEPIEVFVVRG